MLALVALGVGSYSGAAFAGGGALALCPTGGGTGWSHGYSGQATVNCSAPTVNGNYVQYNFYLGVGDLNGANGAGGTASVYDNYYTNALNLKGPGGIYLYNTTYLNNQKITSLAAGTVSSSSTDAINGSQLYQVSSSVSSLSNTVNSFSSTINSLSSTVNSVNVTVNNIVNGGGIKYFHANSGQADSVASGYNSVAVGDRANSMGGSSVAVGDGATATGAASIAIGNNAKNAATANNSVALGGDAASGDKSVTIGNGANTTNSLWAVAVGTSANVSGSLGVAIGGGSVASGANGVAMGPNAVASGANTLALGSAANASAGNSVALGAGSTTTSNLSAAGYNPGASTLAGIASAANGEVSLGAAGKERRITNVAAGSAATDAVNVSQLQSEDAKVNGISNIVNNINNGGGIKYVHVNSTDVDSTASGANTIAIGPGAIGSAPRSVALGAGAKTGTDSWGHNTVVGPDAATTGMNSVALGSAASSLAANGGTALGALATSAGNFSSALGYGATASAGSSVALGANSTTTANLSAAGYNPGTGTLSGIASAANGEVSVGASGKERRITNVAAGSAATDAVNVSQLQSEDAKVNGISGNVSNLSNTVNNINVAVGNITNISNTVTNIVNGGGIKYFHANSTLADSNASGSGALAAGGAAVGSGTNATAVGTGATASAYGDVAIGYWTHTAGTGGATAVGDQSSALAYGAFAGGMSATASGTSGVAIGSAATATGNYSEALGNKALTLSTGDVALGASSTASGAGSYATALGANAAATAGGTSALGSGSQATASWSTALGSNATATGTQASALGNSSTASAANAVAVGSTAKATAANAIAVGVNAQSAGAQSVALGQNANVGTGAINSMALGYAATVTSTVASSGFAIGTGSQVSANDGTALGRDTRVTAVDSEALGHAATASAANSVALGAYSTTTANLSAAGYNPGAGTLAGIASAANGEVSVGSAGKERRVTNVAAGSAATDAVNVSQLQSEDAKVNGISSNVSNLGNNITVINNTVTNIVNGGGIKYFHSNSTLADSVATGANSVAIGGAASASAANSVALGANSLADRTNAVSVGSSTAQRQIINLAAGTSNTDAVNVNQLKGVTAALGGGATVNADGSVKAPTYNVAGSTYSDVGSALSSITNGINPQLRYIQFGDTNANVAQASGTDSIAIGGNSFANGNGALAIGTGARAQGANSVAIGFGSGTTAANTFAVGSSTSTRRIVNVADGVNATDAATVGQVSANIAAAMANLNAGLKAQSSGTSQSGLLGASTLGGATQQLGATSQTLLGATSSLPPDQLIASGPTDKGGMIKALGIDSMAIGLNTAATADNALAIGDNVQVGSAASVGVGQNIAINGTNTVVIGTGVSANASNAIVIGTNGTEADNDDAIAIGNNVAVGGVNTMAIGKDIVAVGVNSVTLGYASSDGGRANVLSVGSSKQQRQIINVGAGTQNTDAVNVSQLKGAVAALGGGATVNPTTGAVVAPSYTVQSQTGISDVGTAIAKLDAAETATNGNVMNITNTVNNIVIGGGIKYFHSNSVLADSVASGKDSVAIGGNASATTANSVALGANSVANSTTLSNTPYTPTGYNTIAAVNNVGEVSVGAPGAQRRITNLAAGLALTDAVNVGQLATEDDKVNRMGAATAAALGGSATYTPSEDPMFKPTYTVSGGTYSNVGDALTALSNAATTGNPLGVAYDDASKTQVSLQGSGGTKITKLKAGDLSAASTDAVNGAQLYATNQNVANLGNNITYINNSINNIFNGEGIKYFHANSSLADSSASGANSVAMGGNASATTANSVALGSNSLANSTTLGTAGFAPTNGTLSAATAAGEVSIGAQGAERRITNLAAGLNGTDAVNVSQLKLEDAKVNAEGTSIASVIGGGSTYDASTGKVTNPTFNIGGSTITTIGGAITNLDNRVYANTTDITNLQTQINDGGIGLVTQDATSKNILVASKTGGSTVDFTGTAGARKLTGVAAGTVSTASLDAVNGAQLFNVAASTANAIGGGSTFDPSTGRITNPTFNIGGATITTIGGAITNLDNRVYANTTDITNLQTQINDGGIGLVTQDATSKNILVASKTGGSTVDFTGTAGARKLTGVAAGTVSTASLDAVNGAQLFNVAASTANAIGGGSTFDPSTGRITNPTFNIGGATITTIGGAITNLDNRVYANTTDITNLQTQINEGGIGIVTQDATSRNLLVGSTTDGSIVDFTGTAGARKLTGVAAGTVSTASLDAVNGAQLFNVASSTANAIGGGSTFDASTGKITNPTFNIGGTTITTIGGAITNLDARVYANSTDITNLQTQINEGGIGIVTQDATSRNILVASKTDGASVDFTGTAGARVLTGVAAGTNDNDAVNVAQLKAAGIINGDGSAKTAVTYDTTTDASGKTVTDYSSITLGDGSAGAAPVVIHNVAAGTTANDAVNYSQYADLVSKVNSISNAGTGVDTLFVGDGDRNTEAAQAAGTHSTAMGALSVANGLQSVATGYASNATGSNAVALGANSTASGNNSVALGAGSVATDDNTVSVGSASQQRRITNVATGTQGTDAVNVSQLNDAIANASSNTVNQAVQQANSYTDQQFSKMNDKMNSLGAAAMAATSLIPNARAEGNFQMSAAAGTYGGASALAVGANYWVSDRLLVNAHVTRATGNSASTGASIGATFGF